MCWLSFKWYSLNTVLLGPWIAYTYCQETVFVHPSGIHTVHLLPIADSVPYIHGGVTILSLSVFLRINSVLCRSIILGFLEIIQKGDPESLVSEVRSFLYSIYDRVSIYPTRHWHKWRYRLSWLFNFHGFHYWFPGYHRNQNYLCF